MDALGQPTAAPGRHVGPRGAGGRFPYRTVQDHARYLKYTARLADYERALRAAVKPGDRVLDLGAGAGVLGLLALRAGAGHVVVLDSGSMLEVARALHQAQGTPAQATFVRQNSRRATLEAQVDVVVCDQLLREGLRAGLVESFEDAARWHLKLGGVLVPSHIEVWAAPARSDALREELDRWSSRAAGLDTSLLRPLARAAEGLHLPIGPARLLGPAAQLATVDLAHGRAEPLLADAHPACAYPSCTRHARPPGPARGS